MAQDQGPGLSTVCCRLSLGHSHGHGHPAATYGLRTRSWNRGLLRAPSLLSLFGISLDTIYSCHMIPRNYRFPPQVCTSQPEWRDEPAVGSSTPAQFSFSVKQALSSAVGAHSFKKKKNLRRHPFVWKWNKPERACGYLRLPAHAWKLGRIPKGPGPDTYEWKRCTYIISIP